MRTFATALTFVTGVWLSCSSAAADVTIISAGRYMDVGNTFTHSTITFYTEVLGPLDETLSHPTFPAIATQQSEVSGDRLMFSGTTSVGAGTAQARNSAGVEFAVSSHPVAVSFTFSGSFTGDVAGDPGISDISIGLYNAESWDTFGTGKPDHEVFYLQGDELNDLVIDGTGQFQGVLPVGIYYFELKAESWTHATGGLNASNDFSFTFDFSPAGATMCSDGIDNDLDDAIDLTDSECEDAQDDNEFGVTRQFDAEGKLVGAMGVVVQGNTYDVALVDSSCALEYDGCDEATDFPFEDASVAAIALVDQVLGGLTTANIIGCDPWRVCGLATYQFDSPQECAAVVHDIGPPSTPAGPSCSAGLGVGPAKDFGDEPNGVLVVWTAVTCDDGDADGVCDADDNCPVDANETQKDTDADGVGDACDPDCSVLSTGDRWCPPPPRDDCSAGPVRDGGLPFWLLTLVALVVARMRSALSAVTR